jgi:hypothetical protein
MGLLQPQSLNETNGSERNISSVVGRIMNLYSTKQNAITYNYVKTKKGLNEADDLLTSLLDTTTLARSKFKLPHTPEMKAVSCLLLSHPCRLMHLEWACSGQRE